MSLVYFFRQFLRVLHPDIAPYANIRGALSPKPPRFLFLYIQFLNRPSTLPRLVMSPSLTLVLQPINRPLRDTNRIAIRYIRRVCETY